MKNMFRNSILFDAQKNKTQSNQAIYERNPGKSDLTPSKQKEDNIVHDDSYNSTHHEFNSGRK